MPTPTEQKTQGLDKSEISSLLEAARNERYSPIDNAPRKTQGAFKAKSLFDMARSVISDEEKHSSLSPQSASQEDTDTTFDAEPEAPPSQDALPPEECDTSTPEHETSELVEEQPPTEAADADAEQSATPPQDTPDAPPAPADLSPPPADPKELEAEWGKGFSAGQEKARSEMQEQIDERIALLDTAISTFSSPQGLDILRTEIIDSVKSLASMRAGSQIDTLTEPFLDRVEDLVERLSRSLSKPTLKLHPDDLTAISPYLEDSDVLSSITLVEASELARGDLELVVEGLRYSDRLSPQPRHRARREIQATKTDNIIPDENGDPDS